MSFLSLLISSILIENDKVIWKIISILHPCNLQNFFSLIFSSFLNLFINAVSAESIAIISFIDSE